MGQWVLQCSIKVQGFLLGTIFGADVPLKFQAIDLLEQSIHPLEEDGNYGINHYLNALEILTSFNLG